MRWSEVPEALAWIVGSLVVACSGAYLIWLVWGLRQRREQ